MKNFAFMLMAYVLVGCSSESPMDVRKKLESVNEFKIKGIFRCENGYELIQAKTSSAKQVSQILQILNQYTKKMELKEGEKVVVNSRLGILLVGWKGGQEIGKVALLGSDIMKVGDNSYYLNPSQVNGNAMIKDIIGDNIESRRPIDRNLWGGSNVIPKLEELN